MFCILIIMHYIHLSAANFFIPGDGCGGSNEIITIQQPANLDELTIVPCGLVQGSVSNGAALGM